MNIVKLTNKIALVTVILLTYWVFIFVCSTVFGFKIFRENMTEVFMLSILGIFAILFGAVILNIMFNLTAIAEERDKSSIPSVKVSKRSKIVLPAFIVSLVVIFALLYIGDLTTSKKKESYLVKAASALIEEQKDMLLRATDYSFSKTYINQISSDIKILSQVEEKFPQVTVIVQDEIDGKPLLLRFSSYSAIHNNEKPKKVDYILSTSSEERKYLYSIFTQGNNQHKFSANDGRYEIYFPVRTEKGIVVIHLSQYSRYGKMGSS
jgi:NADH:ubiquinone oxidoreductase subunit 5 (subunit L)/multisubunit Na+/H+ antiporter MnhA subunit